MLNLYSLCADLKNANSTFRHQSTLIVSQIYSFLNNPSPKTKDIITGWKEDFKYIYGDVATNISSNEKLNKKKFFELYAVYVNNINDETTDIQILFYSIQTYFSLLIKYIMQNILQSVHAENDFSYKEIITGEFTKKYGITNYCCIDWYCWPLFELEHGFSHTMDTISNSVNQYNSSIDIGDFRFNNNYDYIKQIYELVIPKELRHALGEYYTPDWLAETTLKSAISLTQTSQYDFSKLAFIDPTCGSGTFLFKTIIEKRKHGSSLSEILMTVQGIDINPLAVLTAKTNYILSIIDLIDGISSIQIPIFIADVLKINTPTLNTLVDDFEQSDTPSSVIRNNIGQDVEQVAHQNKFDIIIGNPPWVNWEYMSEQYRHDSQHLWMDYGLFNVKGRDLSFSKEDISVLITYVVLDKFLKSGGIIAFVIRQGVFKSAQNGVGFRKFHIGDIGIKVLRVEDLSKIKAFENATTSTALFFAKKGYENTYPVSYYFWDKRKDIKKFSFGAYSSLLEVMSQVNVSEQQAIPSVKGDNTSLWITANASQIEGMKKILGTNCYRARTGVFTGGANAVYWVKIIDSNADIVTIKNITERAKRKTEQVTADIEKTFVFPMLKGSNVKKWNISYDTYLLCPHTIDTKMWPVPQDELIKKSPNTMQYLRLFKNHLDDRKGFAGWEREIQQKEFHAILRIGDYTFSKYKVIWKYIATEFICAVISTVDDYYLGEKLILPNEKIMYVSINDESEAYYLCGVLSSTIVAECVKSYMNPTSISAHILDKLNIPKYDKNNALHNIIADLCKTGHGKENVSMYIEKIDAIICRLY